MDTTQLCTIVKKVGFRLPYEPEKNTDTAYSMRSKTVAQLRTLKMDVTDHVNVRPIYRSLMKSMASSKFSTSIIGRIGPKT